MQASKSIRFWNLRLTSINGRKLSSTVLEKARLEARIKDFTTTKEHIIVERNLARLKLKETIKVAKISERKN